MLFTFWFGYIDALTIFYIYAAFCEKVNCAFNSTPPRSKKVRKVFVNPNNVHLSFDHFWFTNVLLKAFCYICSITAKSMCWFFNQRMMLGKIRPTGPPIEMYSVWLVIVTSPLLPCCFGKHRGQIKYLKKHVALSTWQHWANCQASALPHGGVHNPVQATNWTTLSLTLWGLL